MHGTYCHQEIGFIHGIYLDDGCSNVKGTSVCAGKVKYTSLFGCVQCLDFLARVIVALLQPFSAQGYDTFLVLPKLTVTIQN